MIEKLNKFLMKDWAFLLICVAICAGVVGGTHTYLVNGTGYLTNFAGGQMLKLGIESGDLGAAVGYGGGFLIARVLEGPLVGLIDIGGSMMHGVGLGICALIISMGWGFLIYNFPLAILTGGFVGLVIGLIVMGVRKLMPSGVTAGGTAFMMGVGHQLSNFLAPLFLLSALQYSIPIGIAGALGGIAFYIKGKNCVGGIIIGMFIAAFFF